MAGAVVHTGHDFCISMFDIKHIQIQIQMLTYTNTNTNWGKGLEQLHILAATFVYSMLTYNQCQYKCLQIQNQLWERAGALEQLCRVAVTPFLSDFCCTRLPS